MRRILSRLWLSWFFGPRKNRRCKTRMHWLFSGFNRVATVRFGYASCMERFEWFRFSFPTVPLWSLSRSVKFSQKGTVPVPVPEKRFQRFRFLLRSLEISGLQKGLAERGHVKKTSKIVKKCQKVFRHFPTIFAQGKNFAKKRQKSSKSVKKFFGTFRQFSRGTIFPALLGGSEERLRNGPNTVSESTVSNTELPRTSKFPIRLFFLSDTVWQTVFCPF